MCLRILVWLAVLSFAFPAVGKPLTIGRWLVYLGRDYPLTPQASLTDADAEITLLFMQAAARIEPDLAGSHLWQFDMLSALGRDVQARDALGQYIRRQPDDVAAYLQWVERAVESLQTAETRAKLCRSLLERPNLPAEVSSDLHRRLAEFHQNRREVDQAVSEAEAALRHYELNFAAQQLLDERREKPLDNVRRIARALAMLKASPANTQLAVQLADQLWQLGLIAEAKRCYRHALKVLELVPPETIDEHLALVRIARQCDQQEATRKYIQQTNDLAKSLLVEFPGQLDPDLVAELAWFLAHYDPQPSEAQKLAELAMADRPGSVVARRALGAALRQLNRLEEAKKMLTPVAETDGWAAIELARTLHAANETEQATNRLRAASTQPASSEAHQVVTQLMNDWQMPAPASQPAPDEIRSLLDAFDWRVLEYPSVPAKFLSLNLHMPQEKLPPGEPWRCTFKLTNAGPFPITLGHDMMVIPEVLVFIKTQGDQTRSSGPIIRVSVNRTTRLMPGKSIEVTEVIDIGRIRASIIGTPQVDHEVEVTAILAPVGQVAADGQEIWAPSVGGLVPEPLRFHRSALDASRDQVRALVARSRSEDITDRIVSTEQLAMLLAEHQHLAAKRLRYIAEPINAKAVQAAVLARVADTDWRVRARLAECMRWFLLDNMATNSATRLLRDPHWLVRGLAMRMLADQYREKFQTVLAKAAQADPDEWVRRMSQALLDRLQVTTQPTDHAE